MKLLSQDEMDKIKAINSEPSAPLKAVKDLWVSDTGKKNHEQVLNMLEAKDLVIIDESDDFVMLTPQAMRLL